MENNESLTKRVPNKLALEKSDHELIEAANVPVHLRGAYEVVVKDGRVFLKVPKTGLKKPTIL